MQTLTGVGDGDLQTVVQMGNSTNRKDFFGLGKPLTYLIQSKIFVFVKVLSPELSWRCRTELYISGALKGGILNIVRRFVS